MGRVRRLLLQVLLHTGQRPVMGEAPGSEVGVDGGADLAALQLVPTDPRVQSEMYAAEVEMDCPLTTAEVSLLVKRVVDRAVSASALSRELGIDRSMVGREVEAVRVIAKEVLVSSLGIAPWPPTAPSWAAGGHTTRRLP